MSIFLRRRVADKKSIWPVVFGITYGFTSYALAFLFAIIWLDGYALLPLILYFTEKLIDERKKSGLVVTLILLFVSNLYVSYMVGIFSFFYLVFRLFHKVSIEQNMSIKQAVNTAIRFVLTAVICIFTLGVLILPVGLNILQNRDVLIDTAESDSIMFKGIEILNRIFLGNVGEFNVTLHDNMPFIFVSILFTLLIILFFVSKVFSKKEKYYYGTILVLIYLSFNIAILDIAWQAFDVPNWFCHRFSFVFFPVFYMIAIQTIEKIKEITSKEIIKATLILIAFALISQSFGDLATSGFNFIANIAFILGYMLLLLLTVLCLLIIILIIAAIEHKEIKKMI